MIALAILVAFITILIVGRALMPARRDPGWTSTQEQRDFEARIERDAQRHHQQNRIDRSMRNAL